METKEAKAPKKQASPISRDGFKIKQNAVDTFTKVYETLNGKGGVLFSLRTEAEFFDKGTRKVRSIRYCPGEPSIYADEQSPKSLRSHILFVDKVLVVPESQPNLQEFLDAHPGNLVNGGSKFKLVDNSKSAEATVESEFIQLDAIALIRDREMQDLLPVALALNININADNIEIKRELLSAAKADPSRFIQMFDSPEVKVRSAVLQARNLQILLCSTDSVRWFDSNNIIVSVPAGQDAVDIMVRFCLTDKGAPVYEEVVARLNK